VRVLSIDTRKSCIDFVFYSSPVAGGYLLSSLSV
jgi:hypothetical protein